MRSASKVTREVIEAGSALKVIGRAGAGVDTIDVKAATAKGIVVMNTPGGNSNAVAELTIGLMIALAREIPRGDATMKAGKWEKKSFLGVELAGKTLGLIGIGFVGSKVAAKARGLDMKVLVHDPFVSQDEARRLGVDMVDLDALLKSSDYISLHLPRTPETVGLINAKALAKMKRGVYLVNCARGGIIAEGDLLAALESGQVAGAAVDVYEPEPPTDWSPGPAPQGRGRAAHRRLHRRGPEHRGPDDRRAGRGLPDHRQGEVRGQRLSEPRTGGAAFLRLAPLS